MIFFTACFSLVFLAPTNASLHPSLVHCLLGLRLRHSGIDLSFTIVLLRSNFSPPAILSFTFSSSFIPSPLSSSLGHPQIGRLPGGRKCATIWKKVFPLIYVVQEFCECVVARQTWIEDLGHENDIVRVSSL